MLAKQTSLLVAAATGVIIEPGDLMPGGGKDINEARRESAARAEKSLERKSQER